MDLVPRAHTRPSLPLWPGGPVVLLVALGLGLLSGGCASASSSARPPAPPTRFPGLPGVITEFPVPRHGGITLLSRLTLRPDGNLWLTHMVGNDGTNVPPDPANNRIGRITPSGGISEFPLPPSVVELGGITSSGPGGDLWFVAGGVPGKGTGEEIGRITAGSAVMLFPRGDTSERVRSWRGPTTRSGCCSRPTRSCG